MSDCGLPGEEQEIIDDMRQIAAGYWRTDFERIKKGDPEPPLVLGMYSGHSHVELCRWNPCRRNGFWDVGGGCTEEDPICYADIYPPEISVSKLDVVDVRFHDDKQQVRVLRQRRE